MKTSTAVVSVSHGAKTAKDKAALLAQLQAELNTDCAAAEPELNEAYKKVLDILKPIKETYPGFTPYWLIPQGLAYKVATFLQSKTVGKELGTATKGEIVEDMTSQHLDEAQVLDTLTKRSGDGKDEAKRDMWSYNNKTDSYTLLKPFKAGQN